jgi:protein-L-isoaspartate(D-aspartate) O-methyltransferase
MRIRSLGWSLALLLLFGCNTPRPISESGAPSPQPRPPERSLPTDASSEDSGPKEVDNPQTRSSRDRLVDGVKAGGYVKSPKVLDAMRRVPRHAFMPEATLEEAYKDWPFPVGYGQTISQPTVVGEMCDALELHGTERVLEIGTGTGYHAAVVSLLAREVYSIEIVKELGETAEKRLRDLGYANVHVRIGDGYAGWPEKAPFDRILLTAAPPEMPKALVDQLAEGGVLIAPVGRTQQTQWLVRLRKVGGKVTEERLDAVRFVPMVPKPK